MPTGVAAGETPTNSRRRHFTGGAILPEPRASIKRFQDTDLGDSTWRRLPIGAASQRRETGEYGDGANRRAERRLQLLSSAILGAVAKIVNWASVPQVASGVAFAAPPSTWHVSCSA